MVGERFAYAVSDGWLRDLASEPTPGEPWPCLRWDDRLLDDQVRFLDAQRELGVDYNVAWGLFVSRSWPPALREVIDGQREARLRAFVEAAHARGVKVLTGMGVYSWGFDEIIAEAPSVSAGDPHNMCGARVEAWEWQRRVLDFVMDPRWGLDGISLQSADLGGCRCETCSARSPAEYHADLLVRCAEHVRANRPDWVIGQASWGMRLDEPGELEHILRIGRAVDYMIEVRERSAEVGRRGELVRQLECAFGSVGGVFVEPPQHWDRLRWFLPCGLRSARALSALWCDGGRACEYFYRPFANPGEEVSWRTGAAILSSPTMPPEEALAQAVAAVYGVAGAEREVLRDWYARAEDAYFDRADFLVGQGPLSLEPLVWDEDPGAAGPPVYLLERMTRQARREYRRALAGLLGEMEAMAIPNAQARERTLAALAGALGELAALV